MRFIYADTETGGLYPSIHALLSIGACCNWDAPNFHAYITAESQPEKIVAPDATKKNGYSREKWEALGARPLIEVIPVFLAWIEARKKEQPAAKFVCHHLAFDKPFIAEAARACGIHDLPHRNDWRCSQVLFGELMDRGLIEAGSSSLSRLKELCGYDGARNEMHDALQDAIITREGHAWLLHKQRQPEATLHHLYERLLSEQRGLESAMQQLTVWAKNGQAEGRPLGHLLEEMTCLAESFVPPCDCRDWCRDGRDMMSLHHPRCQHYTPLPADPRYARFGEAMWNYITNLGGDFSGEEISEDILPLAQAAGLCCRVEYDPAIHGEDIEADPGCEIWYWGNDKLTDAAGEKP